MRFIAKIDDGQIDQMDLTITITMTVDEWRDIMRECPVHRDPALKFGLYIAECLGHVTNSTRVNFAVPREPQASEEASQS